MCTSNSLPVNTGSQFKCGVCGSVVRTGDTYVNEDGTRMCLCVLPVRRLIPIKTIKDLEKRVERLQRKNLMMRLELDVLTSHPEGIAAKKITAKYQRMKKILMEQYLSTQN